MAARLNPTFNRKPEYINLSPIFTGLMAQPGHYHYDYKKKSFQNMIFKVKIGKPK